MTPSEYENFVAEIVSGIHSSEQSLRQLSIGSGNKNRLQGASGYKHQIDVSFNHLENLVIVECKRWKKHFGVAEILVLASRAKDIEKAHPKSKVSAIIVSIEGATSGARLLAKSFGIDIADVKSGYEYGIRLGQSIFRSLQDSISLSEKVSVAVEYK